MKRLDLTLVRTYDPKGTNGDIIGPGGLICHSIELPWKENKTGISCIPEGSYKLTKRHSDAHGWHLLVNNVPKRDTILLHEANWAVKQLRGCIAPVTTLESPGVGWKSGNACNKLEALAFPVLDADGEVWLTIKAS